MTAKEIIQGNINRVAETHFILRSVLVSALKNQITLKRAKGFLMVQAPTMNIGREV